MILGKFKKISCPSFGDFSMERPKLGLFWRFWPFFGLFSLITFQKMPGIGSQSLPEQFRVWGIRFCKFWVQKIIANRSKMAPKILNIEKPLVTFVARNRCSAPNLGFKFTFSETTRVDLLVVCYQN